MEPIPGKIYALPSKRLIRVIGIEAPLLDTEEPIVYYVDSRHTRRRRALSKLNLTEVPDGTTMGPNISEQDSAWKTIREFRLARYVDY